MAEKKRRATEASDVVQRLLKRMPIEEIALRARVSQRSVYRWLREGSVPHPVILDGLRRIEQETE